jgi:HSP20 family molecular chaperone IbpA
MSLAQGQYSVEVAQNPRRYFLNLLREFNTLKEEERRKEFQRVNSLEYKLQKLKEKYDHGVL